MKHVKLYEHFSSLPVDYTKGQIEKMSKDEFFKALDKYKLAGDAEQAITLSNIFFHANKPYLYDVDLIVKFGDYVDFMMPTVQNRSDMMDAIKKEENDRKSRELAPKRIPELERSIKHYETMLASAKNQLEKLKSSPPER